MSDHPHDIKCWQMSQKENKKLQNSSLNPKSRTERFMNSFYALSEMLFCKFSQQNVNWNCVDLWKNKDKQKKEFLSFKMEKTDFKEK